MKKIAVILSALLLSTALFTACGDSKENASKKDNDTQKELVIPDMSEQEPEITVTYKEAYTEVINELNSKYSDAEWTYGLIDINGDDIPELVAKPYPTEINLYTFDGGKVYPIMEETAFGFAGNNGYFYLPGENVIFNTAYDMAGAVVYENYCKIGDNHDLENYHNKPLKTTMWKDTNGNGTPDDGEEQGEFFYYGNAEITKEEFIELQFNGDYEIIDGFMTYDEIVAELNK